MILEDRNGNLLSGRIAKDGQWRFPLSEEISEEFKVCITQFEDKRFDQHFGVDPYAIARAFKLNFQKGKVVSGGSTISMQVIRLSRKGQYRTYFEKVTEIIKTFRLEIRYSKKEILNFYCSYAPFGGNVVGLEAAAWKYYGRSPKQLSWAENATLAVLPNNPSIINPNRNRTQLKSKRDKLLKKLFEKALIDSVTYQLSLYEPLPERTKSLPLFAPHLLDRLYQLDEKDMITGKIKTTLNVNDQIRVSSILNKHWGQLKQNGINNVGAMVTDVHTGQVIAYVGNVGYLSNGEGGAVDMIPAKRSTGSIIKPLLYAACLDEGQLLPNSLIPDIPTHFGDYSPQNYNRSYLGAVCASTALVRSLNVPTVRMLSKYGYQKFHRKLKQLGFSTLDHPAHHYGLSMILGGAETNIWDLSSIYSSMSRSLNNYGLRNGKYSSADYREVSFLFDKEQSLSEDISMDSSEKLQNSSVLSAGAIFQMFNTMTEVTRPGLEFYWKDFSSKKVAWKTGTSFGFRDAWAVGCTPNYTVVVWVGNASGQGRPNLTGTKSAAPILFEIFDAINQHDTWFEVPEGDMIEVEVCAESGNKALPNCTNKKKVIVPLKARHAPACVNHKRVYLNPWTGLRVTDKCLSPQEMKKETYFVLPPAQEWYYKIHHPAYKSLPDYTSGCEPDEFEKPMDFIYPRRRVKVSVPRKLDGTLGEVIFEVKHRNKETTVYWHIDNIYQGQTKDFHELGVQPLVGKHTLTVVDENGEMIHRDFEVIK